MLSKVTGWLSSMWSGTKKGVTQGYRYITANALMFFVVFVLISAMSQFVLHGFVLSETVNMIVNIVYVVFTVAAWFMIANWILNLPIFTADVKDLNETSGASA